MKLGLGGTVEEVSNLTFGNTSAIIAAVVTMQYVPILGQIVGGAILLGILVTAAFGANKMKKSNTEVYDIIEKESKNVDNVIAKVKSHFVQF